MLDRIARKIQGATKAVPQPLIKQTAGAKIGLVTVGGCHAACVEAMDLLAKDGIAVNYMRGAASRSAMRCGSSSNRTTSISSSSRTAMRS